MQGARMLVSCGLARHAFATISTKQLAAGIDFSSKTLQGCVCLNRTVALFPIGRVALTSIQKNKFTRLGNAVSIFRMGMMPVFSTKPHCKRDKPADKHNRLCRFIY
ncbi:hypothetical protein [Uruburuella suis]|jgi:hypothetical protein|uniref:hypothetical protein n=1 Tax=Uruburuella suis TaxID=252130 RepID=UPI002490CDA7|nr:hypothetical protein [Uruburuella suis]